MHRYTQDDRTHLHKITNTRKSTKSTRKNRVNKMTMTSRVGLII